MRLLAVDPGERHNAIDFVTLKEELARSGELEEVGGKKDRLVGKLQQKYGYASDEAARRADEWAEHQDTKQQDEATKA